jgi:hypothetical protein
VGLRESIGVIIIDVDFQNFQFQDVRVAEAFRAQALAKERAKAAVETATGQAQAMKIIAEAEAEKDRVEGESKLGVLQSGKNSQLPDAVLENLAAGMNDTPGSQIPRGVQTYVESDHGNRVVANVPLANAPERKPKEEKK